MKSDKAVKIRLISFLISLLMLTGGAFAILAFQTHKEMISDSYSLLRRLGEKYESISKIEPDIFLTDRKYIYSEETYRVTQLLSERLGSKERSRDSFFTHKGITSIYLSLEDYEKYYSENSTDDIFELCRTGSAIAVVDRSSIFCDTDGDTLYTIGNTTDYVAQIMTYQEYFSAYDFEGEEPSYEKYGYAMGVPSDLSQDKVYELSSEIIDGGKEVGTKDRFAFFLGEEEWSGIEGESLGTTNYILFYDLREDVASWKENMAICGFILFGMYVLIALVAILHYMRISKPLNEPEKEAPLTEKTDHSLRARFESVDLLSKVENAEHSMSFCKEMDDLRNLIESVQKGKKPEVSDEK